MLNNHPALLVPKALTTAIRANSLEAEISGSLTAKQLSIINREQWFNLLIPQIYGGLEMSLPDLLRLEESISWIDGSVGWTVTLANGAGWFGGFLHPGTAKRVFAVPGVCFAGSGAPTGEALISSDGYIVSGKWAYASGANHASHFTGNCIIKDQDGIIKNDLGLPLIRPFIFERKDVKIWPTWAPMGLIATGSNAFEVKHLILRNSSSFNFAQKHPNVDSAIYRYPFLQMAEATLAVNLSGMAIHFFDLCQELNVQKQSAHSLIFEQEIRLREARDLFYTAADQSWRAILDKQSDEKLFADVSALSKQLANTARSCIDSLYPYCGLSAATHGSEINRVWRDLHTASQHALLRLG